MNSYELSRNWFDWSFENPEKISPNHSALYFFIIEHCNRLGWKEKFGLPTTMAKESIGIRSYNTYINTLNDLVDFGFIKLIEKSKNQYSSNIIALSNFNKATEKALDKAMIKHETKQRESIDSINKHITINKETIEERKLKFAETLRPFLDLYGNKLLNEFYSYWTEPTQNKIPKLKFETMKTWEISRRLINWKKQDEKFNPKQENENGIKFAWQ
jgi:hypothetical protein